MKHSSTWFALTLIALASLLNGARSVNANSPSQTPLRAISQNETPSLIQREAQQNVIKLHTSGPSSTPTQTPSSDAQDGNPDSPWMIAFTGVAAVATILVAIFTCQLVKATRALKVATDEQVNASKAMVEAANAQLDFTRTANIQNIEIASKSADAARDSAKASAEMVTVSTLGLKADRPYLLIESAELIGVVDKAEQTKRTDGGIIEAFAAMYRVPQERLKEVGAFFPEASFVFRNFGKGPALIDKLSAYVDVVEKLPPPHDFSECRRIDVHPEAIEAGKDVSVKHVASIRLFALNAARDRVANQTAQLIVYGLLSYRDVYKNLYETGFCWAFTPPRPFPVDILKGTPAENPAIAGPMLPSSFVRGPESHNFST